MSEVGERPLDAHIVRARRSTAVQIGKSTHDGLRCAPRSHSREFTSLFYALAGGASATAASAVSKRKVNVSWR
jgi:hypothetical protein